MPDPLDRYEDTLDSVTSPARDAFAVTPHDSAALPRLPKALLVGTAGTLAVRAVDAAADVTIAVTAGQLVPIRASHVRAAGTTAGLIVALV
ncbi:spike base protein, RCAP_Rcc01079 family [Qipengyuania sediminis]|uniref:spike base protein, RCAP_Rcc01079 family n=1 Tax=Qipengyuania sediminis TaxID=1532023 RepID=UPI0010596D12|nr:hypothetical protein [Qipengyuania sediminis]